MSFVSIIPYQLSVGEVLFWIYLFLSLKILPISISFLNFKKHFLFTSSILILFSSLLFNQVEYSIKDIINPIILIVFIFISYLFLKNNFTTRDIIIKAFLYSIYVHFGIGILQLGFPDIFYFGLDPEQKSPIGSYFRVCGLFTNPNDLMLYLVTLIPFTYKYRFFITRYILLLTLLLTLSKVALFVIVLILIYDILSSKYLSKLVVFLGLLLIYISFFNTINIYFSIIIEAIQYRLNNANSLNDRLEPLILAMDNIDSWILFGMGPMGDITFTGVRIHNFFISIFIQYGIGSLLLMGIIALLIILNFVKNYNIEKKYYLMSFIFWTLASFFNTVTYYKVLYIIPILCFIAITKYNKE